MAKKKTLNATDPLTPELRLVRDLDDEASIDTEPSPVVVTYDKAQRELLTQNVDFGISTLAGMLDRGQIDTDPKYQRRSRWDAVRQSRLIESFLMNVPLPPIFLSEEGYGKYAVIDGRQRLRALQRFFTNQLELTGLEVFSEINGCRFSELPGELQGILDFRPTLRCIIIQKYSHPEIKYEVFERLNTGGVALNAQEIRNSAWRGPLNDLILDLSEENLFRRMLRIKNPETSAIVQHMRDCELVLRFLALKDTWENFSGSMRLTLNHYMAAHQNPTRDELIRLRSDFMMTLDKVHQAFGGLAFCRWDRKSQTWRNQVVAAMFDAQMLATYSLGAEYKPKGEAENVELCRQLFVEDNEFENAVLEATNTPSRLVYRVLHTARMLRS